MKRTLIPVVVLALVLGAPIAFAETVEVSGSASVKAAIESKREALKQTQENMKKEIEMKREGIKKQKEEIKKSVEVRKDKKVEERQEFRIDMAKKNAEHTISLLNAMADRLQTLIDRTASRITKVKTAGGTTAVAETNLDLAKTDLAKARAQITALGSLTARISVAATASSSASTTERMKFEEVKSAVKEVKATFNLVHKDLEKAVSSLNLGVKTRATTTAPTSATGI